MACKAFILLLVTLCTMTAQPVRAEVQSRETADAHAKLEEILHRPEFTAWRLRQSTNLPEIDSEYPSKWGEQIKRPFRAIGDFLKWAFRDRTRRVVSPQAVSGGSLSAILKLLAWVVVAAVLLFMAIVLVRIIGTAPRTTLQAHVLSREQVRAAMESGDALALGTTQWMDEARRLAAEQDFRAVYRALYLALLSGLHTVGKIEHNRNRTNWAYVQHYRGPEIERDRFSELTELFDRVWYGRKPADNPNLEKLQADVALLTRPRGAA